MRPLLSLTATIVALASRLHLAAVGHAEDRVQARIDNAANRVTEHDAHIERIKYALAEAEEDRKRLNGEYADVYAKAKDELRQLDRSRMTCWHLA